MNFSSSWFILSFWSHEFVKQLCKPHFLAKFLQCLSQRLGECHAKGIRVHDGPVRKAKKLKLARLCWSWQDTCIRPCMRTPISWKLHRTLFVPVKSFPIQQKLLVGRRKRIGVMLDEILDIVIRHVCNVQTCHEADSSTFAIITISSGVICTVSHTHRHLILIVNGGSHIWVVSTCNQNLRRWFVSGKIYGNQNVKRLSIHIIEIIMHETILTLIDHKQAYGIDSQRVQVKLSSDGIQDALKTAVAKHSEKVFMRRLIHGIQPMGIAIPLGLWSLNKPLFALDSYLCTVTGIVHFGPHEVLKDFEHLHFGAKFS
mmetsp:Transcript_16832/g.30472  ORF Transcript_16832/g.30472 Transcript_16832/m.30472 type:complete len:314 (+) Transcript_16832:1503-2444(+)